jgi:hypothetical protein
MPQVKFEPTPSVFKQAKKINVLRRAVSVVG